MINILKSIFGRKRNDIPLSIYDFKFTSVYGKPIDFSRFKGKKILLVNVASRCGFTPQYEGLEALYNKFNNKLEIIGFPANDFLWQESGSNKSIAEFCELTYKVSFPIAEKISVRGFNKHPIYEWLTNKEFNKFANSSVKWNFQKYLVDENGNLIHIFGPEKEPLSKEIIEAIT